MPVRATLMERCLLYLLDRSGARGDDSEAEKLAQDSIAEALHARQAHVSRAMRGLSAKGFVKIAKTHVRGKGKRRFAYMLTSKGLREARELRQRFEDASVIIVDLQGIEKELRLREVYALLLRRPRMSDLITNLEDGHLDLRHFVAWQGQMCGGKVYDVREAITVPHFTGRAEGISRLDEFLGEPRTRGFLLVGLPGVGKTALVSHWVARLRGRVHVFWRCVHPDTTRRDLLLGLADMLHSVGKSALSNYLRRPSEDGRDISLNLLRQNLSEMRFLIVLDNAHLAGKDAAELVTELLHLEPTLESPKVILLARERVQFCSAEDKALGRIIELELSDLPRAEADAMLSAMGVDADRREAIMERCGGHPLSLELAAAKMMPLDMIRRTSTERLAQDVLSRLDPAVCDTLAFAAMFESGVPLELMGGHVSELLRLCILREEDGDKASMHDLVRQAALGRVSPNRLSQLHVRAGEYLAHSRDPSEVLEAVRHFTGGGAMQEANELVVERGHEIIDAGLAESLIASLNQLTWDSREGGLGSRILLLRGHAWFALGRWAEATRDYDRCSSADNTRISGEAILGQGKVEVQRYSPLALQHLKASRELLEQAGSLRLLAEAQYWIGGLYEDAGHLEEAWEAFERGRSIAFAVGDRQWEGLCTYGVGRVQSLRNDETRAAAEYRESLRALERGGYRLESAKVCAALGGSLAALGQTDEAETILSRAIAEARAVGAVGTLASSLYNLASLRHKTGDMKKAIPALEEALGLYEQLEKYDKAAWCAAWIASEEWIQGNEESGDSLIAHAEKLLARTTEPALRIRVLGNLARAASRAGRNGESRRHQGRAIAEARAAGLDALLDESIGESGGFD